MANLTRLSVFNTRLDSLLQGVQDSDLSSADRDLAIRHAITEYNRDLPARAVYEFPGDGGAYYPLFGKVIDIAESLRDAGIDLASTGAGSKLGIKFTLPRRMEVHQVNLWLSRTGATVAGTLAVSLYTVASSLPDQLIATSSSVDPDGVDGAPRGRYDRVSFPYPANMVFELPAGDYYAVLESTGYTYANGTNEIILGVDQSGATNDVATFDAAAWTAYGTDSAGILEVIAGIPGWRSETGGSVVSVEYPAADTAASETPNLLEDEQYGVFRTANGAFLRFPEHRPSATENVRLTYSRDYAWVEATDPVIDTPAGHFEAICSLAAAVSCEWLATRYGQKRESSINADSVERRTQADVYMSLAAKFRKAYTFLSGQGGGAAETRPGMAIIDLDLGSAVGRDFLFHSRGSR